MVGDKAASGSSKRYKPFPFNFIVNNFKKASPCERKCISPPNSSLASYKLQRYKSSRHVKSNNLEASYSFLSFESPDANQKLWSLYLIVHYAVHLLLKNPKQVLRPQEWSISLTHSPRQRKLLVGET